MLYLYVFLLFVNGPEAFCTINFGIEIGSSQNEQLYTCSVLLISNMAKAYSNGGTC